MLSQKIFGIISLGCDKNRVDTEKLLGLIKKRGYATTDDLSKAQIVVVNTCAFLQSARQEAIETILESIVDTYEKIKMFVAVYDGKPCGFLVGNIPKTLPVTENITYSSRHNAARYETEIDWLVTWNPNRNEKIKGIGKALVGEFFRTLKGDKFRDVVVRSEVPEFSYAASFYESLGFERLGKKRTPLSNKNTNPCVINDFSDAEEQVIPMVITKSKINKTDEGIALSSVLCYTEKKGGYSYDQI